MKAQIFVALEILAGFVWSLFSKPKKEKPRLYNLDYLDLPPFKPWGLANTALLQTFVNYLAWMFVKTPAWSYKTLVKLPDNAVISLDCFPGDKDAPVVIVFPGIQGNAKSHYVKQFVSYVAMPKKITTIVYNRRGFNGSQGTAKKPFGRYIDTEDMAYVVEHVKKKHPGKKLFGIGISVGGSALVRLMAEHPGLFGAGVTVSNMYNALLCVTKMPWVYNKCLAIGNSTIQEADRRLIMPYHPLYKDLNSYYLDQCCHKELGLVQKPLCCINAEDDILGAFCADCYALEAARTNPFVKVVLTKQGGHVGWAESFWDSWLFKRALPEVFADFLKSANVRTAKI